MCNGNDKDYEPCYQIEIPITAELLEESGFKKDEKVWRFPDSTTRIHEDNGEWFMTTREVDGPRMAIRSQQIHFMHEIYVDFSPSYNL